MMYITSCLLGAAKILTELKDEWEGTVKLIFQPAKKKPRRRSLLIKEGVWKILLPKAFYGLHVHTILDTGKLSFRVEW
jgi:hippurate hydrolase